MYKSGLMEIHKYDMDKKMIRCYRIELILKEDSDSNACLDYCEYLTRSCECTEKPVQFLDTAKENTIKKDMSRRRLIKKG